MEQPASQNYTQAWLGRNPENFPVASKLLPPFYRANIMALYQFARGADEIADDPVMPNEAKRKALTQLENALMSGKIYDAPEWAEHGLMLAKENPNIATHARDLLSAFLQDTEKSRYNTLDDLMHYCMRSAAPVGRAILDIAGEKDANRIAADALCNALQILNHVRDMSKDYLVLHRIYMPLEWFREANASEEELSASRTSAGIRKVMNKGLAHARTLLDTARALMPTIEEKKLRLEVGCIHECALLLHDKLLEADPLKTRINLNGFDKFKCLVRAWLKR